MTNSLILAEDTLPLEKGNLPLLPLPYDLVWSIVCFVLILWLFWKFVLPKFQEVLSEREDRIEGGIQRAEAAQSEAKAALQKYNDQLAEARAEAARIRDEARVDGQKIVADMKTEATEESNRRLRGLHRGSGSRSGPCCRRHRGQPHSPAFPTKRVVQQLS